MIRPLAAVVLAGCLMLSVMVGATLAQDDPFVLEPGFTSLFDGSEASFAQWQVSGDNGVAFVDGVIETRPGGDDLGLLYYAPRTFSDFDLRLQFRIADPADDSGVHVRFRDPTRPVPDAVIKDPAAWLDFPNRARYIGNGAWLAVDSGFEVQIDDQAAGNPTNGAVDGLDQHRTAAIYDKPLGDQPGEQDYHAGPALVPGAWNDLEIEVRGQTYNVWLNGQQTTSFINVDPLLGVSAAEDSSSGYIGIQSIWFNPGHVDFRNIRIRDLTGDDPAATPEVSLAGTPVRFLGASTGNPDRPMREPSFLAIDPGGTVWVADGHHSQFQLFSQDGTYLETWGEPGDEAGQFNFVRSDELGLGAVAFARDGTMYVADTGNDRVQVFDADRNWLATWGSSGREDGQFVDPIGITVGPDGFIYVVDDYRDDVQVFQPDGAFVRRFGQEGTGPGQFLDAGSGIAIDREGNVLVADFGDDEIERFAPDGAPLLAWGEAGDGNGQLTGPQQITFDAAGRLYVADSVNKRIQVFTADGAYFIAWGGPGSDAGQFQFPVGLALDRQGNVFVSDTFDGRMQAFQLLPPLA